MEILRKIIDCKSLENSHGNSMILTIAIQVLINISKNPTKMRLLLQ